MSLFGGSCLRKGRPASCECCRFFNCSISILGTIAIGTWTLGLSKNLQLALLQLDVCWLCKASKSRYWQAFKVSLSMCLLSPGKFILYTFWKNAIITMLLFYYTFFSGYSGTCCLEAFHQVSKGWELHPHSASTEACSPAQFGRRLAWSFFGLSSLLVFLTGMSQMSKRSNTQHCMRRDALDWSLPCTLDKYLTRDRSLLGWFCCPASNSGSRHLYTFVRK